MINSKITKPTAPQAVTNSAEERVFKYLEGIDWKLWEIYKMLKEVTENNSAGKKKE